MGHLRTELESDALRRPHDQPQYSPLIGFPLAWTDGTNGPVRGDAILAVLATPADLEKYKGQLRGKMVLTMAPHGARNVDYALGASADR